MALSIKNQEIIGEIDNLQDKLDGRIPIDRLELLVLVNSWGRNAYILTQNEIKDNNLEFCIDNCEPKECYNLSKLDVSQITNMDSIFEHSNYNGDIGNWDVSNVTSMFKMFAFNREFNSPLNNWNTSNVVCTENMFWNARAFDQNISSWNLENAVICNYMFDKAESFINKYNSGEDLSYYTDDIKEWFKENRDKMYEITCKRVAIFDLFKE